MHDEPDPPRRHYQFKEREFERVNPKAGEPADDAAIDINDLYRSANDPATISLKKTGDKPVADNEVLAMLRENNVKAAAAGMNDIKRRPKRKSKRLRDYLIVMTLGNVFLISCLAINPIFAGVGFILFNIVVWWVMWMVMEDY